MTVRLSRTNVRDVLYELACDYPGGFDQLADRMGVKPANLRNRLGPKGGGEPTIRDLVLIIEYSQGVGKKEALEPLQALCARLGGSFVSSVSAEETDDEQIHKQSAEAFESVAAVSSEFKQSVEDGQIQAHEMDRIEGCGRRAIHAVQTLLAKIRVRAKKDASKSRFFKRETESQ